MKTELCEIAYKYGTDKCPQIYHSYTPFYYELLKDKKDSIKKVLEFGVGSKTNIRNYNENYRMGSSLYMWRDFFPKAKIYGADILPETVFKDGNIETFLCDERKPKEVEKLIEKIGSDIDLFIDDGSHLKMNQIRLCLILKPLLKKDVIYIIEDVKYPEEVASSIQNYYDCDIIRFINKRERDDNLIIVKNRHD